MTSVGKQMLSPHPPTAPSAAVRTPVCTPQSAARRKKTHGYADVRSGPAPATKAVGERENTDGLTTDRPQEFLPLRPGQPRRSFPSNGKPASRTEPTVGNKKHQERAYGRPDAWLSPSQKVHDRVSIRHLREIDAVEWKEMEEAERKAQEERERKIQRALEKKKRMQVQNLQADTVASVEPVSEERADPLTPAGKSKRASTGTIHNSSANASPSSSQQEVVYVDEKWLSTDNVALRDWNIRKQQAPDSSDLLVVQQAEQLAHIKPSGTEEPEWLDEDEPGITTMERARRRVANNLMHKRWQQAIEAAEQANSSPTSQSVTPDPTDEGDGDNNSISDPIEPVLQTPIRTLNMKKGPNDVDFYGSMNAIPFLKKSPVRTDSPSSNNKHNSSIGSSIGTGTGISAKSAKLKKKMSARKLKKKASTDSSVASTSTHDANASVVTAASASTATVTSVDAPTTASATAAKSEKAKANSPKPYPIVSSPRALNEQQQLWKSMSALDSSQAMLDRPGDFLPLTPGDRKKERTSPMNKSKERAFGRPDDWISPKKSPGQPKYRIKKDVETTAPRFPGLDEDDSDRLADDD